MHQSLRRPSAMRALFASASITLTALFCAASVLPTQTAIASMAKTHVMAMKPANVAACTGCHGKDLSGKKGFSPSIRASGVLKEYNKKTFARLMKTGVTNDGGRVKKPMPVFHYTAKEADPLYVYLKSLK